jgi:hypothetical protein
MQPIPEESGDKAFKCHRLHVREYQPLAAAAAAAATAACCIACQLFVQAAAGPNMQPIPEESESDDAQSVGRSKQKRTTDKQTTKRTKAATSKPAAAAATKPSNSKAPTWK